jgi:hypothetical protein
MLQIPVEENDLARGILIYKQNRTTQAIRSTPGLVSISPRCSTKRDAVARFIKDVYRSAYNARIDVHYPILMSVSDSAGTIQAAIGFRYAVEEPLFLEQYIRRPIEKFLDCRREQVVEIGNLASVGGGVSLYLFAALASYLHYRGIDYAVATGTKNLQNRLRRIGLQPRVLCPADPAGLASASDDWGTYYDTAPTVLAGRVDFGFARLKRVLGAQFLAGRPRLLPRLHYAVGSKV